jgi:hypothetical protein
VKYGGSKYDQKRRLRIEITYPCHIDQKEISVEKNGGKTKKEI